MSVALLKTDEEYVHSSWMCPLCDSTDVEGAGLEVDGNDVTQVCICKNCGSTWTDLYRLVGYMDFELGGEE